MLFCVPILQFARVNPVLLYRGAGRFMPLLNNSSYDLSLSGFHFKILLQLIFSIGSVIVNHYSEALCTAKFHLMTNQKRRKEG